MGSGNRRGLGRRQARARRSWLLVPLIILGTSGCTGGSSDRATPDRPAAAASTSEGLSIDVLTGPWLDRAGEPVPEPGRTLVLAVSRGPEHCNWQSAVFLHLAVPIGTPAPSFDNVEQYVRDPEGRVSATLRRELDLDADLTGTAEDSGFSTGDIELWVDPAHRYVLLTDGHTVERWPRRDPAAFCA